MAVREHIADEKEKKGVEKLAKKLLWAVYAVFIVTMILVFAILYSEVKEKVYLKTSNILTHILNDYILEHHDDLSVILTTVTDRNDFLGEQLNFRKAILSRYVYVAKKLLNEGKEEEVKKQIENSFYSDTGYVFAMKKDKQTGKWYLWAHPNPKLEGIQALKIGKVAKIMSLLSAPIENGKVSSGYYYVRGAFYNPKTGKYQTKIYVLYKFPMFNLVIGTGKYLEDFSIVKKKILKEYEMYEKKILQELEKNNILLKHMHLLIVDSDSKKIILSSEKEMEGKIFQVTDKHEALIHGEMHYFVSENYEKELKIILATDKCDISKIVRREVLSLLIIFLLVTLIGGFIVKGFIGKLTQDMVKLVQEVWDLVKDEKDFVWRTTLTKGALAGVGKALNKFVDYINYLLNKFKTVTNHNVETFNEFSRKIEEVKELLVKINEQAEQISAAGEEVASGSREISSHIVEVNTSMQEVVTAIDKAAMLFEEIVDWTGNVGIPRLKQLSGFGHDLDNSVEKIKQAVEIISTIAKKTNLLALNAAIEAARAGESGRGFAVVAEEIRKLADNTAKEVKAINEVISEVVEGARNVVEGIEAYVQENEEIVERINNGKQTMQEVKEIANVVSSKATEVAAAAEQSTQAIEEVSQSVVGIAENVAFVNEIMQAITEQLKELNSDLNEFRKELNELKTFEK